MSKSTFKALDKKDFIEGQSLFHQWDLRIFDFYGFITSGNNFFSVRIILQSLSSNAVLFFSGKQPSPTGFVVPAVKELQS